VRSVTKPDYGGTMTTDAAPVRLTRYLLALIGAQFAFGMALNLLDLAGIKTPGSLSVVGGIVGTLLAAQMFVGDHKRAMVSAEKWRFAIWGTVLTLAMGIALFTLIVLWLAGWTDGLKEVSALPAELGGLGVIAAFAVVAIAFSVLFYYLLIGWYTRLYAKKIQKTETMERTRV
jgi:hypothetical protein